MTPRQFDALARVHRDMRRHEIEHQEFLFAQLTAMVANTGFRGWKEVRTAEEFMPSRWKRPRRPKRLNRKAIADRIRRGMAAIMARQNRGLPNGNPGTGHPGDPAQPAASQ